MATKHTPQNDGIYQVKMNLFGMKESRIFFGFNVAKLRCNIILKFLFFSPFLILCSSMCRNDGTAQDTTALTQADTCIKHNIV